jgi:uncharacterized membrane protein (DUF4010 family)
MMPEGVVPEAWQSLGEAFLIGLLVGIQREGIAAARTAHLAGVRDFPIIAITGAVCGLLQSPALTAASVVAVAAFLISQSIRHPERAPGVTTELAAVATFGLGYLTAAPAFPNGATLAIGAAIAMVVLLEAKRHLHRLVRQELTEAEFSGTLRFLAIIFIIYPLLPEGAYGPYEFFAPRRVWLFVILVSSISYVGYFLKRVLGERGLNLTAVLGGLASTTAATASLAKSAGDAPAELRAYTAAVVLANAVQMPRVLAILYAIRPEIAGAGLLPLLAMSGVGFAYAWILYRGAGAVQGPHAMALGNPFRLVPALKFGAVFAAVVFLSKWALAVSGGGGLNLVAIAGGAVDVDAVSVAACDLAAAGKVSANASFAAVMIALVANAVLKTGLAFAAAGRRLGAHLTAAFAVMFASGLALLWLR